MTGVVPAWMLSQTAWDMQIADQFHKKFYENCTAVTYLGIQCLKNPLDLWVYQEILFETKPDVIIECGTAFGGTTLYLAHILDQIGNGRIISIDLADRRDVLPQHPRIEYWIAQTLDYMNTTGKMWFDDKKVMVILDSDHSYEHVKYEMLCYAPKVTKGQYLIVEDTNIGGHPVGEERKGPADAVKDFMVENNHGNFVVDKKREKFMLTYNPGGYLKRVT